MRKDALLLMREMGTSQSSVPVWLIKYCEITKNFNDHIILNPFI